jgi:hypothetical protein
MRKKPRANIEFGEQNGVTLGEIMVSRSEEVKTGADSGARREPLLD